jgi:indolepyruvate ferredoxin oxidoreductase
MGDAIAANLFLLGFAFQKGTVPLGAAALLRAIEINGVAVKANQAAFRWGRQAAVDLAAVERAAAPAQAVNVVKRTSDAALVADRVAFLTAYQNAAYAARYADFVARVQQAESGHGGKGELTRAVASNLFKLMAYKDEYEVARLYTDGRFHARLAEAFEGKAKLSFHLAPPIFGKRDAQGQPVKQRFGAWMLPAFRVLAALRRLRGTPLDVFGRTAERRMERQLVEDYRADIETLLARMEADGFASVRDTALAIARLPEQIRGFGHVKEANVAACAVRRRKLLRELVAPVGEAVAVAA